MSQQIRTKKEENKDDNTVLNELLTHIEEKYNISKVIFESSMTDIKETEFYLKKYKRTLQQIDDEIEAINMNEKGDSITIDVINTALKKVIKAKSDEEKDQFQSNNRKKKINNDLAPAKKNNITINENINVKYNTTIVYNEGENQMEKQFNIMNPEFNEKLLQLIEPYDLLPKDSLGQLNGYQSYFLEIKEKFINENKLEEDPLLERSKFVLFIAFDIIDSKPSFSDLVGIDPLKDYKKYKLRINTNSTNIFLVSGQIVYIEGDLIDDSKIIEVQNYKNVYDIIEYNISIDSILPFYKESPDPYAIYYMNGPYFSKDSKDLSVFNDVLKKVAFKNPHFFIINGPFFSTENEKVKWGELDTEEGMKDIISQIKKEFVNTRTKILICPGISDNENFYPLPQPPFDKINDSFITSKRNPEITFISNPQIFQLNEAYIGVVNFDVIKDIIFNSVHSPEINTVDKACEMILYQKNFYPVLPNTLPVNNENNQERVVTVDLSQYKFLNFDDNEAPPDIILTNTMFRNFAKKIHGTVFVNCGCFMKGKNYGEIAKITLHKASRETDINKRVKVEFIKINQITNNKK